MKIRSHSLLFALYFLLIVICWFFFGYVIFTGFFELKRDLDSILLIGAFVFLVYFVYYAFMLLKVTNFILSLDEEEIIYSFVTSKVNKYSEIDEMIWINLEFKWGGELKILKLKFNDGSSIVFSMDKITKAESNHIIDILKEKSQKDFKHRRFSVLF